MEMLMVIIHYTNLLILHWIIIVMDCWINWLRNVLTCLKD